MMGVIIEEEDNSIPDHTHHGYDVGIIIPSSYNDGCDTGIIIILPAYNDGCDAGIIIFCLIQWLYDEEDNYTNITPIIVSGRR